MCVMMQGEIPARKRAAYGLTRVSRSKHLSSLGFRFFFLVSFPCPSHCCYCLFCQTTPPPPSLTTHSTCPFLLPRPLLPRRGVWPISFYSMLRTELAGSLTCLRLCSSTFNATKMQCRELKAVITPAKIKRKRIDDTASRRVTCIHGAANQATSLHTPTQSR